MINTFQTSEERKIKQPNLFLIKNIVDALVPYNGSASDIKGFNKSKDIITLADMKSMRVQGQILKILGYSHDDMSNMYAEELIKILTKMLNISKIEAYATTISAIALKDEVSLQFLKGILDESQIDIHNYKALTLLMRWVDTLSPKDTASYPKLFQTATESVSYLLGLIKTKISKGIVKGELLKVLSSSVLEVSFASNWQSSFTSLIDAAIIEVVVWPESDKALSKLPIYKDLQKSMSVFTDKVASPDSYSEMMTQVQKILGSLPKGTLPNKNNNLYPPMQELHTPPSDKFGTNPNSAAIGGFQNTQPYTTAPDISWNAVKTSPSVEQMMEMLNPSAGYVESTQPGITFSNNTSTNTKTTFDLPDAMAYANGQPMTSTGANPSA